MAEKRKLINLLPEIFQGNDQLSKFFSSTVDPLIQVDTKKKLSGYIGQIPSYFNNTTDFYLNEPTSERQFYQLEPTMTSTIDNDVDDTVVYPDIVNHLRFQGADTSDHSRLFDQKFYTWSPPIDIDKFLNFSNYFWAPEGPTTINITAEVSAPIDVNVDIIGQINYTSPNNITFVNGMKIVFGGVNITAAFQNKTYIIEGVGRGIVLVSFDLLDPNVTPLETTGTDKEYITISRESRDENPWSRTNHWYHKNVLAFIDETVNNIISSDEAVLWDADPWDILPWDAVITTLIPAFALQLERQAKRPIIEFEENLELFNYGIFNSRRATYLEDSSTNVLADIHGQAVGSYTIDGLVLAVNDSILVTKDLISGVNNRIYNVGQVEVTPGNFFYTLTVDTTGLDNTGTPTLGEKVIILAGNDRGLELYFDGTAYIATQRKITDNQPPLFNLYDTDGNFLGETNVYKDNTFAGSKIFSYIVGDSNDVFDTELGFNVTYRNFQQTAEILFENNIQTEVFRFEIQSLIFSDIKGYYYYKNFATDVFNNTWYLSADKSTQTLDGDFYEIPLNLQGNPDYEAITTTTRSETLKHFVSIIENQTGISGPNFAQTNYRNTARDPAKGKLIVQNEASMLKLMLLGAKENYDFMLSSRFVSKEYRRFLNRVIKKVEMFINQGMDQTLSNAVWLDDAIKIINTSKKNTTLFPFINTRTIPEGDDFTTVSYILGGTSFALPGTAIFDPATPDRAAISVYLNNSLLLIGYDYTITNNLVVLTTAITSSDTLEVRYYPDITGSFLPASGATLGLTRVYKPARFVDNTFTVGKKVLRGHDGSLYFEYGDKRDEVMLELETRIYNTILEKFKLDKEIFFDIDEVRPGKFRTNDYTLTEYANVLTPIFTTWALQAGINWTDNITTFDQGDWKTWNWTGVKDIDGIDLVGSWRAIYMYYYDTFRPDTNPWEMLGFSEEPFWWIAEYGTGPYTSANTKMWTDLSLGRIRQGTRAGIDPLYVRLNLSSFIPVNLLGEILSPQEIGIAVLNANVVEAQADWLAGDWSPAETAFWNSSERSFFTAQIHYLLKPAKFINLGWDTQTLEHAAINKDQIINSDFDYRPRHAELIVDSETVNKEAFITAGIQQWVANRLQFLGVDISNSIGTSLRGLGVSLGWRAASFVYKSTLRFKADSASPGSTASTQVIFVRDDDINIELHESNSISEVFYGGVVVEWTGTGYQIVGYDSIFPYFRTIPSETDGEHVTVTVGGTTVKQFKNSPYDTLVEVPYGFEYETKQDLYDFLVSYGRWLEFEGWVFDTFDPTANEILNWKNSGKEFLFWADDLLEQGAFITLSPAANQVTFAVKQGHVSNVEEIIRGTYSILDRSGRVVKPEHTTVFRNEGLFQVVPDNEQGIYALRLNVKEIENIVLFKNTTRFNDVLYSPLFNLRQPRLKAFGQVSGDWTGRLDAPGFLVDPNSDNNLIPNFEKLANDFRTYFDIENPSENDKITDVARHLIGYQRRTYLDNLLIDRDTQYQFYQGFIKQKGSRNVLNRLFRSTAITSDKDVSFLEEWAVRVNQYGALESQKHFELRMLSSDIKNNPQIVRFTKGKRADVSTDTILDIVPNDERWVVTNDINNINKFTTRAKNTRHKRDLPNAGYPQFGETTYIASNPLDLLDDTKAVFNAGPNETVWTALDKANYLGRHSWDVMTLVLKPNLFAFSDLVDLQIVNIFAKESFVGDGVTTIFNVTGSTIDMNTGAFVAVDGKVINGFTVTDTAQVTFTTAPVVGEAIDVYYLAPHTFTQNVFVFAGDAGREVGIAESFGTSSIVLRAIEDNLVETSISQGTIAQWETVRFVNVTNLADVITQYPNHTLYFDSDVDGWAVHKTVGGIDRTVRIEAELIDVDKINNGLIYDELKDRIISKLTLNDPYKGIIPGIADTEIFYKLENDPAKYNNGPITDTVVERTWGEQHVGRVWWDLSKVAFVYYEQGSLEYKYQNWGGIFPGTTIDVFEWVRSPVPPDEWAEYVQQSKDNFDFSRGGTVKNLETVSWVEQNEGGQTVYYFWVKDKTSVPNVPSRSTSIVDVAKIIVNPVTENVKTVSILEANAFMVANIEGDLNDQDTVFQFNYRSIDTETPIHMQWELLRENDKFSFILDNHWNKLRDSLVGFDDLGKEVPDLRLKGNARFGHNFRPRQTWFKDRLLARQVWIEAVNKILGGINVVDTITDFDKHLTLDAVLVVPDTVIDGTVANATVNIADQMTVNGLVVTFSGLNGTSGIADDFNAVLSGGTIVASIFFVGVDSFVRLTGTNGESITLNNISGGPLGSIGMPNGTTDGLGPVAIAPTRAARNLLSGLTAGDRVFIDADEELRGYWSYWEYLGGLITLDTNWVIVEVQSFNTDLYWNFIDWFDEGFSAETIVNTIVPDLAARNLLTPTATTVEGDPNKAAEGDILRVDNDGSGKWTLYELNGLSWTLIGKQDSTIIFLDTLYEPAGTFGFDEELFELLPFDDYPQVEFRNIIDGLRLELFIGIHEIEQNIMFFKMINHVHSENSIVDWIFKTSYLFILGFTNDLTQKPIFVNDGFESVVDYVNEAKPYHTKIKDVIRTFATAADPSEWRVLDYDKPPFDDNGTVRILDETDSSDFNIMLTTEPWLFWADEFEKDLRPNIARANNVRKIKTKLHFDRISSIRKDWTPALTFPNHPDYPDTFAPTPFFTTATTSTAAKDTRTIKLLENFEGDLANLTGTSSLIMLLNGNLTGNLVSGTMTTGSEAYTTASIIPALPDNVAFAFDGNRVFRLPDNPDINTTVATKRSVSFAFRSDTINDYLPQILYGQGDSSSGFNLTVIDNGADRKIYATLYENGGTDKTVISAGVELGQTYFVTYQFDTVEGIAELFLNGVLVATASSLAVGASLAVHGQGSFGGISAPDDQIGPLSNTVLVANDTKFIGQMQHFIYYSEAIITATQVAQLYFAANSNIPDVFNLRRRPFGRAVQIVTTGTLTASSIIVEGSEDADFSTPTTIATITSVGSIDLDYSNLEDTPFLRINFAGYVLGDTISVNVEALYENALSRVLDFYAPGPGLPNLLDLVETYYLGTILDGFALNLTGGWDASPWDFAGWDADSNFEDFLDRLVDGGSFFTFTGDNTTAVYNLPSLGNPPWYVAVTDPTGLLIELDLTTDYTVTDTQITLVPGKTWMTEALVDDLSQPLVTLTNEVIDESWASNIPIAQITGTDLGSGTWLFNRGTVTQATGTILLLNGIPIIQLTSIDTGGSVEESETGRMGVYIDVDAVGEDIDLDYIFSRSSLIGGQIGDAKFRFRMFQADAGGSASVADQERSFMPPDATNIVEILDTGLLSITSPSVPTPNTIGSRGRYVSFVIEGGEPNLDFLEVGPVILTLSHDIQPQHNVPVLQASYLLSVLDSTYLALNEYEFVYDGNEFTQPDWEGWPEELVPLKVNDSALVTITSGDITVAMLTGANQTESSDSVYFQYRRPVSFTVSGIAGDTVLIEGSKTGAFLGEEVTVATITTNITITVPDTTAGYVVFPYYRARVSIYSTGLINVTGHIVRAPNMEYVAIEYDSAIGVGPYEIGQNINQVSDLLVVLNDIFLEHTVDYLWFSGIDGASDAISFTSSHTDGDRIQVHSWDTTISTNADPIWLSRIHDSTTYDLGALNVEPGPTTPKENSMFVFGDDGSGWKRLAPPQARYYRGGYEIGGTWDYDPWDFSPWDADEVLKATFNLAEDQFGGVSGDVTVWVNNILQVITTNYTFASGGQTNPSVFNNSSLVFVDTASLILTGLQVTFNPGVIEMETASLILTAPNVEVSGSIHVDLLPALILTAPDVVVISGSQTFEMDLAILTVTAPEHVVRVGGGYTVNDVLTVVGGTGTATQLRVASVDNLGFINGVDIIVNGLYSILPINPVSVTGGTGSGALFILDDWDIVFDTITFVTASIPEVGDRVSMRILGKEDYTIDHATDIITITTTNLTVSPVIVDTASLILTAPQVTLAGLVEMETASLILTAPNVEVSGSIHLDLATLVLTAPDVDIISSHFIAFYSFRTDDQPLDIQTKVFCGRNGSILNPDDQRFRLDSAIRSIEDVILTVAGATDSGGITDRSFSLLDAGPVSAVNMTTNYLTTDRLVITTIRDGGNQARGIFVGYEDTPTEFREDLDFTVTTTIAKTTQPEDKSILLADARRFSRNGGVAWVNGERIEYLQRTGGVQTNNGALTGLIRGSKGTRRNKIHKFGNTIRSAPPSNEEVISLILAGLPILSQTPSTFWTGIFRFDLGIAAINIDGILRAVNIDAYLASRGATIPLAMGQVTWIDGDVGTAFTSWSNGAGFDGVTATDSYLLEMGDDTAPNGFNSLVVNFAGEVTMDFGAALTLGATGNARSGTNSTALISWDALGSRGKMANSVQANAIQSTVTIPSPTTATPFLQIGERQQPGTVNPFTDGTVDIVAFSKFGSSELDIDGAI